MLNVPNASEAALGGELPSGSLNDRYEPSDCYMIEPKEMGLNRFGDSFAVVLEDRRYGVSVHDHRGQTLCLIESRPCPLS